MLRQGCWVIAAACVLVGVARGAEAKFSIKQASTSPPSELSPAIRNLLEEQSIQLLDDKGQTICEVWFRKEIPAKATPEQIKNGLTYRELEESTVVGAIRYEQPWNDYRKQKIKPGVYTLRIGIQPMDGDHMGTAPHQEFFLLAPAKLDQKPNIMDAKDLRELSAKAIGGSHPGVLLLYPNEQPEDTPKLLDKGMDTFALALKRPVSANGQKATIGIALTLVGQTTAE